MYRCTVWSMTKLERALRDAELRVRVAEDRIDAATDSAEAENALRELQAARIDVSDYRSMITDKYGSSHATYWDYE